MFRDERTGEVLTDKELVEKETSINIELLSLKGLTRVSVYRDDTASYTRIEGGN